MSQDDLLAFFCCVFRHIITIKEASLEQLNSDNREDELKEHIDNHDVKNVLQ